LYDRVLRVVAAIGLFWGLACDPNIQGNPNSDSGRDAERGMAQRLALGEPVNDDISHNAGDMTDWKYFQIPAPGTARVVLGCDYTSAYCAAVVRDQFGVEVDRLETRGQPMVSVGVPVQRGNYYLEIFVQASSTDYTIQVDYEPN
jgi:hypothetical protein